MASSQITKLKFIEIFQEKNIDLFTVNDARKVFSLVSSNTLKSLLRRLKKERIIESLQRGKYLFLYTNTPPTDFQIANFLNSPSYISLESALSFYGVLEQFPYKITSLTLRKSKEIRVKNKVFSYSKIEKKYFFDFVRENNFLIATYEKALFDYFYFTYKGLRPAASLRELGKSLNEKTKSYLLRNSQAKFSAFIKKHVKL